MSNDPPNLERLQKAREANDLEELEAACRALLAEDIDDITAHEIQYQLGLCLLWRKENLDEAITLFGQAAKHPSKDAIATAARTSLAIAAQPTKAKAIFELRKMIPKAVRQVSSLPPPSTFCTCFCVIRRRTQNPSNKPRPFDSPTSATYTKKPKMRKRKPIGVCGLQSH